ncbi:MAG: YqaA family protein [Methylovirgula sp.]|jgi:membrane protein YqaA with SNARE-associated domain
MFKKLYSWTLSMAQSRHAPVALGLVAFAESSFFPIPPDTILVPMLLARPNRALLYALICTVASVLGGILGYAIGAVLFQTVGKWLISIYGYGDRVEQIRALYAHWGWAVILIKGFTPIPFKIITITSGLLAYSLPLFILLSIITRAARFFFVAAVLNRFGGSIHLLLEKYFGFFLAALAGVTILGFWIAGHMV